jgi:glucose-1-phosphate cytidylyltransferase
MKTVILAGGFGTRISEESSVRPKPMVEIGGKPILWHIMKIYAAHGISEFIICCGYKGHVIKDYFASYQLHASDVTFDLKANSMQLHGSSVEPWKVTLVDTGESTMTGGRIRRIRDLLADEEAFCLTYGDGVADLDLTRLVRFHQEQGRLATLTAVQPPGRFGAFTLPEEEHEVRDFREKPRGQGAWVNGGFFVLSPRVIDYIEGDDTVWERGPLTRLASEGQLSAYRHTSFWQPMDTLRDKRVLEEAWGDTAPWKIW